MRNILIREVSRHNPFRLQKIPWIAQVYRKPFDRWASVGRQALFGAPNLFLFVLYQRLWPFTARGTFTYSRRGEKRVVHFNSKNTQFRALYLNEFSNGYEPQTAALLAVVHPREGVFYDIGSNWGWCSLSVAAQPGFKGQIHAFEPFPSSYKDLQRTVAEAGVQDCVSCHHVAISDQCGAARMVLPDHVQSGLAVLKEGLSNQGSGIPVASLDSLNLAPPSTMKVDVEGAEIRVFRGGAKMIAKHKPMIVFENTQAHLGIADTLDPIFFLQNLGYVFFQLAWRRRQDSTDFLIGDDNDPNPNQTETLALVEFDPAERLLLSPGMNIFACHSENLPKIEAEFSRENMERTTKPI